MAKASTSTAAKAKAPAKRDPLDHDGDGKRGGSLPKAKRTASVVAEAPAPAVVDGTLPDPVIETMPVDLSLENATPVVERPAGQIESLKAAAGSGRIMATVSPGAPVTDVEMPELTPDLEPAGALMAVYREDTGRTRLAYANGAVRHPRSL